MFESKSETIYNRIALPSRPGICFTRASVRLHHTSEPKAGAAPGSRKGGHGAGLGFGALQEWAGRSR